MPASKVCFVSSEVTPFAKTGGLADVAAALPRFLHQAGHDVRVFLPFYSRIDTSGLEIQPVDFLRDVTLRFGPQTHTFTVHTTRLPRSDLSVYLVACPELYDRGELYTSDPDEHRRFALLARAAIEGCQRMGWAPDVFHCNDWHAALVPLYLKTLYAWDALFGGSRTLLTIHNIGYQGVFPVETLCDLELGGNEHFLHQEDLRAGRINFLKTGVLYADVVSTVSPTYAREIQTEAYGAGLEPLLRARQRSIVGILNGVDYGEWSPENDPHIPVRYSSASLPGKGRNKKRLLRELGLEPGARVPVVGIVSRLTSQKGLELLYDVVPTLLARDDIRLAVLGSGDVGYERFFSDLQRAFPRRACFYRGYSEPLAHLIEAGADMFLMPSRYEPCGLNQMFSLRYGTVPIVRATGGLADSVEPFDPRSGRGTGFLFEHFTPEGLRWALGLALRVWDDRAAWRTLMLNGMERDFSWERQGQEYVRLYRRMTGR